jgi:hypothetical protein
VGNFPSQGNGALISHFMNIQFMNFEKEKRKYQEKIGTEKYRQQ